MLGPAGRHKTRKGNWRRSETSRKGMHRSRLGPKEPAPPGGAWGGGEEPRPLDILGRAFLGKPFGHITELNCNPLGLEGQGLSSMPSNERGAMRLKRI